MAVINLFLSWIILLICSCNVVIVNTRPTTSTTSLPTFPAILIFGDSVMDTGNNNNIKTWVKANYPPYGQSYPGHIPTGRFSNGKLIPDFLASFLGIKQVVPPFLDPKLSDHELITGVNFASAGSGFDDSTSIFSNVIPVSRQLEFFKVYIQRIKGIVGEENAMKIINGALVILSAGTNDWIFNFYDVPTRRLEFNVSGYQDFLLNKLQTFTKELYGLGCRSIIISGLAPTGCLPIQMNLRLEKNCLEDQNRDSQTYNKKLVKLITQMQATLPGTKIVYNDLYGTVMDMLTYPEKYGFVETKKACCENGGEFATSIFCDSITQNICKDPSKFLFWDMIHPTLAGYQYVVAYMLQNVIPQFL